MMHVGGYYEYCRGCSLPWGKSLRYRHSNGPLRHHMEHSSHMCGTYHLNNYHHNSKSIGIICGASYGTHLKGVFGQLPLYRHCSKLLWYHMGSTCTSVLGQLPHCHHYSRPCGYRVKLHMRPAWTSVWGSFHTIVTRSDPSGIIMRLRMGPT